MELSYYAQEMGLAGNLLYPNDEVISNQQHYYEYSTDYSFAPSLPGTTQNSSSIYGISNATNHVDSVSGSQAGVYPPIYAANFQPNSIEGVPLESSVFLSPQTSASSSAAQSPQAETQQNAVFDLSLDEIFDVDVDDILNSNDLISDDLLDVLNGVQSGDFLSQLEVASHNFDSGSSFSSDSSVASNSPKRKFSTDSSDCASLDSFDTCSTVSSGHKKARRSRGTKNPQERASRKKDQNKKAASRYRDKKKNEMQSSEQTLEELESHRDSLSEQVKKLQTEFNVILPLAQAAFTFDPIRRQHLNQLLSRINSLL